MDALLPAYVRSRGARRLALRWSVLALVGATVLTAHAAGPAKRARPPKFDKTVTDAFFQDAREKLVGSRPIKAVAGNAAVAEPTTAVGVSPPLVDGGASTWSKLISAEVLEDEIKAQLGQLGKVVQNPVKFKGGDYQLARTHLSLLAALFAIDADYGQPMRWQREAPAVRDLVARSGFNCKVGTDATYKEAKARFEDLQSLVRGDSIAAPAVTPGSSWDKVADRAPLMKRLEQAHDQGLAPWTAGADEFSRRADKLAYEAQLIAALAAMIQRDGYEFADDETYREYAEAMRTQATRVRDAALARNYDQARQAVGEISKACASCHEGYRN